MKGEEEHSESPRMFAAEEGQMLWSSRAQGVKLVTQQWKSWWARLTFRGANVTSLDLISTFWSRSRGKPWDVCVAEVMESV